MTGIAQGYWVREYVNLGARRVAYYAPPYTRFDHVNSLGSTSTVTEAGGSVVDDVLFYPWGQNWGDTSGTEPYLYGSMMPRDRALNLDLTPFRLYASNQGRWLSPDPVGGSILSPQSLNRYGYVGNNPSSFTDPLGLQDERRKPKNCGAADPLYRPCNPDLPPSFFDPFRYQNIPVVVETFVGGDESPFKVTEVGTGLELVGPVDRPPSPTSAPRTGASRPPPTPTTATSKPSIASSKMSSLTWKPSRIAPSS